MYLCLLYIICLPKVKSNSTEKENISDTRRNKLGGSLKTCFSICCMNKSETDSYQKPKTNKSFKEMKARGNKILKKWIKLNKNNLEPHKRKIEFYDVYMENYILKLSKFQELQMSLQPGKKVDPRRQKIKVIFREIPEFFAFYWVLLNHAYLQMFLVVFSAQSHQSSVLAKLDQIYTAIQALYQLPSLQSEEAKVHFENAKKSLSVFYIEKSILHDQQFIKLNAVKSTIFENEIDIHKLTIDRNLLQKLNDLAGLVGDFFCMHKIDEIRTSFISLFGVEEDKITKIVQIEPLNESLLQSAQTIVHSCGGLFTPIAFIVIHQSIFSSFQKFLNGAYKLDWFPDVEKLSVKISDFYDNLDNLFIELSSLGVINAKKYCYKSMNLFNTGLVTKSNYLNCIEQIAIVNTFVLYMFLEGVTCSQGGSLSIKKECATTHPNTMAYRYHNKIE